MSTMRRPWLVGCACGLVFAAAGCSGNAGCPPSRNAVSVTLDEERVDLVCTSGTLIASVDVQANHYYALVIDVAAGTLGNTRVPIEIGGDPFDAPFVSEIDKLEALGGEVAIAFIPDRDGTATITIVNRSEDTAQPTGPEFLFGNQRNITTRMRVEEQGVEDHGRDPTEATRLPLDGTFVEGILYYGDEHDFVQVPMETGKRYRITAESTSEATVDTANVDRFGQFNPHVASLGGTEFALLPRAGVPSSVTIKARATEDVLVAVSAGKQAGLLDLLAEKFDAPYADFPIRYAISVENVEGETLKCDPVGVPPAVDWADIERRARIVFEVTCTERTNDELTATYEVDGVDVIPRVLSTGTRYLLFVDPQARTQELFLPGTNTSNLNEVITDLNSAPVFDSELGATFHRGFLGAAELVRSDVTPLLDLDFTTRLTGYSLGGATAAILALQLELEGFKVDSIVTFGQPKVTDQAGASQFSDQPLLRIKAGLDGISHIFAANYYHFGDEIILLDGDRIVYLPQSDRNYDVSTDSAFLGEDFTDHTTYLDRLPLKLSGITPTSFCDSEKFITPAIQMVCE